MTAKIKLSEKQKEVIESIRKGNSLIKNVTYASIICGCTTPTFFALKNKGLIERIGFFKQGYGTKYVLTKLGKSLSL